MNYTCDDCKLYSQLYEKCTKNDRKVDFRMTYSCFKRRGLPSLMPPCSERVSKTS